ncbi:hypothetical protein DFH07DRAFT_1063116 [Mycena maculata]|uniref:Uncharacterized protein n=1 Tax=Mycena maculata TaxID=230809 RepID=A0AAD7N517_9AGAR|nr:hypothetical protein DFH07DRAFT_1063116 [Mycena maculata]
MSAQDATDDPSPPSLPSKPPLAKSRRPYLRRRTPSTTQAQTYLPSEPDCALDLVGVPIIRGMGIVRGVHSVLVLWFIPFLVLPFFGSPYWGAAAASHALRATAESGVLR